MYPFYATGLGGVHLLVLTTTADYPPFGSFSLRFSTPFLSVSRQVGDASKHSESGYPSLSHVNSCRPTVSNEGDALVTI